MYLEVEALHNNRNSTLFYKQNVLLNVFDVIYVNMRRDGYRIAHILTYYSVQTDVNMIFVLISEIHYMHMGY